MAEELKIISENLLTGVSETEVNSLIEKMIDESKENMDEICELTLECTTLLSSAENRTSALSNQSTLKRLVGNVTGKNRKLRDAVLSDNTNAMYAAQGVINRVMKECTNNRKMMIAVNERVNDIYLELQENQNDLAAAVLMTRQAIVNFYKKYQDEYIKIMTQVSTLDEYGKRRCPECNKELLVWQRVCPICGYIHPLKRENMSEQTQGVLEKLSNIVKDNSVSADVVWNITAQKKERVLRKVKLMAETGKLPGYTKELSNDVDNLLLKCKSAEFQIAIVGVMKAGKSFLMNALIGAEIASVQDNPETAALTKFRSSNGFYVKVRFYNQKQWEKLKASAKNSNASGANSFGGLLERADVAKLEKIWVGHEEIHIACKDIDDLKMNVKKYTSSQLMEHLFAEEVEVGVDRSIFNMPSEVVFVDTPGLKDPVKYRSEITRNYIKKADAVLVAVPTEALTVEGNEVITTVLDCTDAKKAYIVATKKDVKNNEEACEEIVSLWVKQLVEARRYSNERNARNRIILTSAKMDLLLNKWINLSDEERGNEECFPNVDFNALEKYVKDVMNIRSYDLTKLPYDEKMKENIAEAAGIVFLRDKLEKNLIAKSRDIKVADIEDTFTKCKSKILKLSNSAIKQQENDIELAKKGAEELRIQIEENENEKKALKVENDEFRKLAQRLTRDIANAISSLEREE